MAFKDIDLFSSFFQFNFDQRQRKGTLTGAILTAMVFSIVLGYFIYLLLLFFNNQIDPKYASQSFVQDDVSINLQENLFGFRYEYDSGLSLDDLQYNQNQTYLVFQTYFLIENGSNKQLIELNHTKCSDPQLYGYNCFDFSKIQDQQLELKIKENLYSSLYILIYRCADTDQFKQFIPSNCANQTQIDQIINNPYATFRLKLYTSQFNMSSSSIQVNYRLQEVFLQGQQFQLYQYKVQKQITAVKQGILIQNEKYFSSPISYYVNHQTFSQQFYQQTGEKMILEVEFQLDEIVEYIKVQYPTLPEILAICNSTLTLLMCIGFIGKILSKDIIRKDIFMLILSNLYYGTFENILYANNVIEKYKQQDQEEQDKENYAYQDDENNQNSKLAFAVPNLETKSKLSIDEKQNQFSFQVEDKQRSINIDNMNENSIDQFNEQKYLHQSMDSKYKQKYKKQSKTLQIQSISISKNVNYSEQEISISPKQLSSFKIQSQSQKKLMKAQNISEIEEKNLFQNKKTLSFTKNSSNQIKKTNEKQMLQNKYQKQTEFLNQLKNKPLLKKLQQVLFKSQQIFLIKFLVHLLIKLVLFKSRFCKKRDYLISKGLEPKTKKEIEEQIDKSLDIMQLYKDIIFLKKAIMILLSHEQLAAIQLVGIYSNFIDKNQNFNHFEEQFAVFKSQDLQNKYLEQFFKRIASQKSLDIVDQRLASSIF